MAEGGNEFSVIKIDGQVIGRLIDTVSAGVGALTEPWLIKRRAKAEGAADVIRAESQAQVAEVLARAEKRLAAQEVRRQENLEAVVNEAARILEADSNQAPTPPVSPDWTARLLGTVQDIGDAEMRSIWARILAGEVKRPGSFSLRTLEIVRNLSVREAQAFNALSLMTWENGALFTPLIFDAQEPELQAADINFDTLSEFETMGLIRFDSLRGYGAGKHADLAFRLIDNSEVLLRRDEPAQFNAGLVMFTHAGRELVRLAQGPVPEPRIASVGATLRKLGWNVRRLVIEPGASFREVPI